MKPNWPSQGSYPPRPSNQGSSQHNSYPSQGSYPPRPSNQGSSQHNSYADHQSGSSNFYGSSQYYPQQSSSRGNIQNSNQYYANDRSYTRGTNMDEVDQQYLSRQLSLILRHKARDMKLHIDSGGFVAVNEILHLPAFRGANLKVIEKIVENDSKQRFHLKMDDKSQRMIIRANQGHTFELENLDLKEILDASEFPTVLHGTYYESWKKIKTQGLKTMQRNHIHFAADMPGSSGVISGMRQSCEIILYLNLEKALKDGIKFYLSSNNVILSPGNEKYLIEPQYFEKVVDYMTGRHLSLTEPVETGPTKSSNISERVALREGIKPDGKSNNYPPGYNPVDDTSSEKADRKKKKKKKQKGLKNNDLKDKVQNNMAEQEGKNMKASKKQESDIIESEQKKSLKPKRNYEITSAVNAEDEEEEVEEETVTKSKRRQKVKKIKQESSNSEDEEEHVTEEQDTVKSENDAVILQQFDPTLEQELLELDTIAVLAQSKVIAAGNINKLIIFDNKKEEDIKFLQKMMNNHKSIKLITQMTSCNMKDLDIKQFRKVLDLSILYNEMNEKPVNGDVKALYEKATCRTSKLASDIDIQSEYLKMCVHYRKAALFMWQAFEFYKYYEERLDQVTQKKMFTSSLEALKKKMSSKN
ncbi:uncharacterized protein LOC106867912 isoform X2 [Octopus bimaculoides]|uniref:uncharacterized protein LOC106867912 isoform X2 n=1 Tax=Octopus bimaculoides TaxID=37653 RepID=UPI00071C343F|nr:uncharacterized protein LOC106867912 isoform X2 [Octopus bimaculoides]|eukprot:XP_014768469.1 PREDICTED: uncharacterized protein LOC106867912 isoform X2 [Octopus bimaculoides]